MEFLRERTDTRRSEVSEERGRGRGREEWASVFSHLSFLRRNSPPVSPGAINWLVQEVSSINIVSARAGENTSKGHKTDRRGETPTMRRPKTKSKTTTAIAEWRSQLGCRTSARSPSARREEETHTLAKRLRRRRSSASWCSLLRVFSSFLFLSTGGKNRVERFFIFSRRRKRRHSRRSRSAAIKRATLFE